MATEVERRRGICFSFLSMILIGWTGVAHGGEEGVHGQLVTVGLSAAEEGRKNGGWWWRVSRGVGEQGRGRIGCGGVDVWLATVDEVRVSGGEGDDEFQAATGGGRSKGVGWGR
ncbi:hypothetical protein Salat_2835900 [Sesamum alatum]|uniref:Glycine-rich protein n=1 Tax=Sesamum alatum TaxID=300844 RepID=A0AAE2C9N0_9LAMI|nr:hypothetical protein Salat_2835900 [Sesamum alatum]